MYPFEEETYKIIGACMTVHRELGHGFLESIYQEALALEFTKQGIPFSREQEIPIFYKNEKLKTHLQPDFICCNQIILELKALSALNNEHIAQVMNYIKASNLQIGLLVNFGTSSLQPKRIIR